MSKSIQLQSGQKFNRLTVIKLDHTQINIKKHKNRKNTYNECVEFYLCKCECGKETIVEKKYLKQGNSKSCGCLQKEKVIKHNLSYTRIYQIYKNMIFRCYNKKSKFYYNYGGKNILVCQEWLDKENGLINFYNWAINNGYKDNLTIDRIDNNGNYEPSNCRWVDMKTQERNRSNNHLVLYDNKFLTIAELSGILNLDQRTLLWRIKKGWSMQRIEKQTTDKYIRYNMKEIICN